MFKRYPIEHALNERLIVNHRLEAHVCDKAQVWKQERKTRATRARVPTKQAVNTRDWHNKQPTLSAKTMHTNVVFLYSAVSGLRKGSEVSGGKRFVFLYFHLPLQDKTVLNVPRATNCYNRLSGRRCRDLNRARTPSSDISTLVR